MIVIVMIIATVTTIVMTIVIIMNIVIVINIFNQDGGGSIDVEEIRDIVVGLFRFFAYMIILSLQNILPIIRRVTNNIMCVKIIHNT